MKPPGEQRIPNLPDGLANPSDGEKVINDRHAKLLREFVGVANFVRLLQIAIGILMERGQLVRVFLF